MNKKIINYIKYLYGILHLQNDNYNNNNAYGYGINLRINVPKNIFNNLIFRAKIENVPQAPKLTPGGVNYVQMFKHSLFINKIKKDNLFSLMKITAYQNNLYKKIDIKKYLESKNFEKLLKCHWHLYKHPVIYSILGTEDNSTIIGMSVLSTKRKSLYDSITGVKVSYIEVPTSIYNQAICGSIIYFKVPNKNLNIVIQYLNDNTKLLKDSSIQSVDQIKDVYLEHLREYGVICLRFGDRINVDMDKWALETGVKKLEMKYEKEEE